MSVKCPACGFDSPAESKWCDFCKEPFRPKKAPAGAGTPLDPKEIEKALAKDWGDQWRGWSPRARSFSIAFLMGLLALLLIAGLLVMMSGRAYEGPGDDLQLGKPQVISIPKTE